MLCFHSTQTLQLTLNHHSKFPEQSGRPSLFDMHPLDSVGSREVQRQHQLTLLRGNWMRALGQVLAVGHLTPPLHGRRSTDVVILSGRLHHSSEILSCLPSVTQVACFRTRFQIQVDSSNNLLSTFMSNYQYTQEAVTKGQRMLVYGLDRFP